MINILTYIVSTIFTYVLGKLSKKYGWNETLPIPVQNIIVGLIVFALSVLVTLLLKQNLDIKSIAEQIIVAFGGSGTATLAYDTKKSENTEN